MERHQVRSWGAALLLSLASALWPALCSAQGAPESAAAGDEAHVRFGVRHKLSSHAALKARIAFSEAQEAAFGEEVDPARSSFRVRLPKGYRPQRKKRYGLVIWLSPDATGRCPQAWRGELRRQGLILVGPDGAGNDQPLARRMALALDALAGASASYRVDPSRVYALGFSGGGNVAAWLGLHFPDLFAGVALLSGCDTYRRVPIPGRQGSFWRGSIPTPSAALLLQAKERVQVFFSGDQDPPALNQARAVSQLHRQLGFRRVTLRIAPGLSHLPCPPRELRRVLAALAQKGDSPKSD